jgi:hypothetical protein
MNPNHTLRITDGRAGLVVDNEDGTESDIILHYEYDLLALPKDEAAGPEHITIVDAYRDGRQSDKDLATARKSWAIRQEIANWVEDNRAELEYGLREDELYERSRDKDA